MLSAVGVVFERRRGRGGGGGGGGGVRSSFTERWIGWIEGVER